MKLVHGILLVAAVMMFGMSLVPVAAADDPSDNGNGNGNGPPDYPYCDVVTIIFQFPFVQANPDCAIPPPIPPIP